MCSENHKKYVYSFYDEDNYFDDEEKMDGQCNLTCAFINKAYSWFFSEVDCINEYFRKKGIDIEILLYVDRESGAKDDILFAISHELKESAQQFMVKYLNDKL
jgi:hypothetical protein